MSKTITTEEGNRLIAEFMEFDIEGSLQWVEEEDSPRPRPWMLERPGTIDDLQYHTSWDWLMPVVEKMADFGCWNIRPNDVRFEDWSPEKRFSFRTTQMDWEREDGEPVEFAFLIWHIAVKGIQWYNQNKKA